MNTYEKKVAMVEAKYGGEPSGNPFLDAMPAFLTCPKLLHELQESRPLLLSGSSITVEERHRAIASLSALFFPMEYMYNIYDRLYRAILTTYMTYEMVEHVRKINNCISQTGMGCATQAESGSILGVPGIGKTSTIRRCLGVMPQVICHTKYQGKQFYCKQVLYLRVECPSDCSTRTLALNIIIALDKALGTNYLDRFFATRAFAVSSIATQAKILCLTHHIGLIVVDEIQNAVLTARANKQIRALVRFLVELTNDTSTAVFFAGTPIAEELFVSQEHLKRRTRGVRLLPMKQDGVYRGFLEQLWKYQFTIKKATLTSDLANLIYEGSCGIPAYIVKIFQEAQNMALMNGTDCIGAKIIRQTIDILAIKLPKSYGGGTSLSAFSVNEVVDEDEVVQVTTNRGRKAAARDDDDLLVVYKSGVDMVQFLKERGMLL